MDAATTGFRVADSGNGIVAADDRAIIDIGPYAAGYALGRKLRFDPKRFNSDWNVDQRYSSGCHRSANSI